MINAPTISESGAIRPEALAKAITASITDARLDRPDAATCRNGNDTAATISTNAALARLTMVAMAPRRGRSSTA